MLSEDGNLWLFADPGYYHLVVGSTALLVQVPIHHDDMVSLVESVNGQTGVVVLDAVDVGADPAGTAAGLVDDLSGVTDPATARCQPWVGVCVATTASTDYATAAQGATADTAVQPGDLAAVAVSRRLRRPVQPADDPACCPG